MTLARVEFPWGSQETVKKLSDEDYAKVRDAVASMPEKREDFSYFSDTVIDIDTDGKLLSSFGIEFTVKKIKGTVELQALTGRCSDKTETIHVHVPNIGLLSIDEVQVLEDACTNVLQGELDDGWRILAVCPPNCQRRPDYVLGRTKEAKK